MAAVDGDGGNDGVHQHLPLVLKKMKGVNVSDSQHESTVPGMVLCRHDREILAKVGASCRQHVADIPRQAFLDVSSLTLWTIFLHIYLDNWCFHGSHKISHRHTKLHIHNRQKQEKSR